MINDGKQVLYGSLDEIRKSYTRYEVQMDLDAETQGLNSIESITRSAQAQCIHLKDGCSVHDLMAEMAAGQRTFQRFEEARMPIEDIFVEVVGKSPHDAVAKTEGASS
jgi:ABC-type uncharacterized transport system ATPase subunit